MINRIFTLLAILVFLAACETAPRGAGVAGGTSGTGSGTDAGSSSANSTSGVSAPADPKVEQDLFDIGNRVLFAYDSSALSAKGKSTLDKQVAYLKRNPSAKVRVEGHADERGTREYNLALGERRATAARDYLVSQGIQATRVRTISYGKERPAVTGSNETAWAQNRRSVTVSD